MGGWVLSSWQVGGWVLLLLTPTDAVNVWSPEPPSRHALLDFLSGDSRTPNHVDSKTLLDHTSCRRHGDIDAAVHLAQTSLASFDVPPDAPSAALVTNPGGRASSGDVAGLTATSGDTALLPPQPSRALLRDVVSLVAYEKPEASSLVGVTSIISLCCVFV